MSFLFSFAIGVVLEITLAWRHSRVEQRRRAAQRRSAFTHHRTGGR